MNTLQIKKTLVVLNLGQGGRVAPNEGLIALAVQVYRASQFQLKELV